MRYHDYHLRGYSVSDFGERIVLDLVYDYPGKPILESQIEFTGVALYHFEHTAPAIIIEIIDTPISTIVSQNATQIEEWNRQHGITDWPGSCEGYAEKLGRDGLSGWYLCSAIGFFGIVIGKEVMQKTS